MNRDLTNADYMTGGMVYLEVIMRERALKYRGKCVDAGAGAVLHQVEQGVRAGIP